jgi:hypothetical protein
VDYYTRVLSKDEEYPSVAELAEILSAEHPDFRLTVEEGSEEEWETLLLAGTDEVEVALVERYPVTEGSIGEDELSDFLEDLADCRPESGVAWLREYFRSVKTVYAFQHLQGAETVDGSNALHALRTAFWERGSAIQQADGEGFTNEDGYHIVWQFSDSVSGPWNMAVLDEGTWLQFTMDLGDPEHREAFLRGEAPEDRPVTRGSGRRREF